VAIFWNAAAGKPAVDRHLQVSQSAAQSLGIHVQHVEVTGADALDAAFQQARKARADAIVTIQSALFHGLNGRLAELSLKYRLPVLSSETGFAAAGGLMNYGDNIDGAWRRSATQVDRILKGAKPGDLPVEQSTKFELVINLKTAKALGLTIPPSVLARTDQVIE
jgi:putative ABC transport system substrate-binding protein